MFPELRTPDGRQLVLPGTHIERRRFWRLKSKVAEWPNKKTIFRTNPGDNSPLLVWRMCLNAYRETHLLLTDAAEAVAEGIRLKESPAMIHLYFALRPSAFTD